MIVFGIDPGTTESGFSLVGPGYEVLEAGKVLSGDVCNLIRSLNPSVAVVESLQSYGAAVGREVFETAYWIGEYRQVCRQCSIPFVLYPRPEYARAIAGVQKVTDSVLRQALLLRFGSDTKGGPLFKLRGDSDRRSAYAIAVYHLDKSGLHHSAR
ncbi:MAG: hypothetical protein AB7I29_10920 [Geobacter sp.]